MTGLPPRNRTQSAVEEANVTAFVDATVNFKTNCSFEVYSADAKQEASYVLFLAQGAEAAKKAFAGNALFDNAAVQAALSEASEGKIYATTVVLGENAVRRVLIGLVSSKASRYNCAARPDVITNLVSAAFAEGKKVTALDVFSAYPNTFELAVAQAIAKASHSFTAKGGAWENSKAYCRELPAVKAFLQGPLKSSPEALAAVAESVQLCARLVDAPTNLLDTTSYPQICQGFAKRFGFEISIMAGEELREKGYGGLYGVGKAAEFPAALVTMSYKPTGGDVKEKIALVGKGMVYDCGGLSIKVGTMCTMKCDMGGSAGVLTGFLIGVRLQSPHPLDCVLCIADNAISARAQRNDDIIIMKSGKTVEINNTDAEGRLILGDGVWHAAKACGEPPALIFDMATLTGAQGIAVGQYHAGIYTACPEWESKVMTAGAKSGDLTMTVPYVPEYSFSEFASKSADMKNSVANRSNAQVSCAANFIEQHLPADYTGKWVHCDMAGPAFQNGIGTGYGPALLTAILVPAYAQ